MARQQDHFLFSGGLDLVTPTLAVPNGRLISVKNYEATETGYGRIGGYERHDGRPAPSDARYSILNFEAASTLAATGETVTGATSGASAVLVADPVIHGVDSATGSDGYYVVGDIAGTFQDGEALQVGGEARGTLDGTAQPSAAPSLEDHETYTEAAAARRRAAITAVPGSGPVRGVWGYDGDLYAVRDNAGATEGVLYRATATGWDLVPLGDPKVNFKEGSEEPSAGDRIVTNFGFAGTFVRAELTSGTWSNHDAVGVLYVTLDPASNNSLGDNHPIRIGQTYATGRTFAKVDGAQTAARTTLPPGGRYEFRNHNFLGQARSRKMYGVNGVGPAFEYDGSAFTPIRTGLAANLERPRHLAIQSNHLLLAYPGGSIQNSATGDPLDWTAARGAAEIAAGQEVHGMVEGAGRGETVILGANTIQVLYGADKESWDLRTQSGEDSGAVEWTGQMMGSAVYLDNRGLRTVETTDKYGNFLIGTLTYRVQPWLDAQRALGAVPTASMRMRSRDTYRLFFGETAALSVYFGRKRPECSLIEYLHPVRCACSFESGGGEERLFFGSDDGWVFEAEKGTSFDGAEIEAFARVPYNHLKSPAHAARLFKVDLHAEVKARAQIRVGASFDYGDNDESFLGDPVALLGGGAVWGEAEWANFYWGSPIESIGEFHLSGVGANVSLLFASLTAREQPHALGGATIHYAPRRLRR